VLSKHTFDIAIDVLRPEGGHERRPLGGERSVCLLDSKGGVVREELVLDGL
jgi:hypothetical protein